MNLCWTWLHMRWMYPLIVSRHSFLVIYEHPALLVVLFLPLKNVRIFEIIYSVLMFKLKLASCNILVRGKELFCAQERCLPFYGCEQQLIAVFINNSTNIILKLVDKNNSKKKTQQKHHIFWTPSLTVSEEACLKRMVFAYLWKVSTGRVSLPSAGRELLRLGAATKKALTSSQLDGGY